MKKLKNSILLLFFHDFSKISILSEEGIDVIAYIDSKINKSTNYLTALSNSVIFDLTYKMKYMEDRGKKHQVEFFIPEISIEAVKDLMEPYDYSLIMTGRINRLDNFQCRYEKEAHIQTTLDAVDHIRQKISKYITPRNILIEKKNLINNCNLSR